MHAVADVLLEFDPKAAEIMVFKGRAYTHVIEQGFKSKYARYEDIPVELRPQVKELVKNNVFWYKKAESLGWREETKEAQQAYMQMIARLQKKQ